MKGDVSAESLLAVAIVARFAAGLFQAGAWDLSPDGPSTRWGSASGDTHHHGGSDGGHGGHASDGGGDGDAASH